MAKKQKKKDNNPVSPPATPSIVLAGIAAMHAMEKLAKEENKTISEIMDASSVSKSNALSNIVSYYALHPDKIAAIRAEELKRSPLLAATMAISKAQQNFAARGQAQDKDQIIRDLRAKVAELEEREADRNVNKKIGVDAVLEAIDDFQRDQTQPIYNTLHEAGIKISQPLLDTMRGWLMESGTIPYNRRVLEIQLKKEHLPSSLSPAQFNELVDTLLEQLTASWEKNKDALRQIRLKRGPNSKKSRSQYSDEEKLRALRDWNELDKSKNPITVVDWLAQRFQDKNGVPNVAKSTFYSWKKYFEDRGEI